MAQVELDRLILQALSSVTESDISPDGKRQLSACLRRTLFVSCEHEADHVPVDLSREVTFVKKPCDCKEKK